MVSAAAQVAVQEWAQLSGGSGYNADVLADGYAGAVPEVAQRLLRFSRAVRRAIPSPSFAPTHGGGATKPL
eukprot:COSAG01_NODE_3061_length_6652_cov_18.411567_7_plen_71_part_00